MDQDFHYYATFYAARLGGYSVEEASLIGKCSNFIDFMSEANYAGYWKLIKESTKKTSKTDYTEVGTVNYPRYTFQGGLVSTGVSPEDGLWCSYHFPPGNYADPIGTPTPADNHGSAVAGLLPGTTNSTARYHEVRYTPGISSEDKAKLLNRPLSPLSRVLFADTVDLMRNPARLRRILMHSLGAGCLIPANSTAANRILNRFALCLLGARAHVLADTWAHQDFSGISHKMNTYWDVRDSSWGRQSIEYQDVGDTWKHVVLSATKHDNLKAVPNGTSYLGHGWMGHFPDYSFVKFRYKPCWRLASFSAFERDNPTQYRHAFLELCSLMSKSRGATFDPVSNHDWLESAQVAISTPCEIADKKNCPRAFSSKKWMAQMNDLGKPVDVIDAAKEPDDGAVLEGVVEKTSGTSSTRYGTFYVHATSDLYLFQIAADYHFHFVKTWLKSAGILEFGGSWSSQLGALSGAIVELFTE